MNYLQRRALKKVTNETLRHARHVLHMREDIMSADEITQLTNAKAALRAALEKKDFVAIEELTQKLSETCRSIAPQIGGGGLRENFEVLVVAIAVAMGLRTYFIQPFKIPTGSMQPTLYGVTSVAQKEPGIMDHYPLKLAKFVLTGQWYSEVRAKSDGIFRYSGHQSKDQTKLIFTIAEKKYGVPRDAVENLFGDNCRYDLNFRVGSFVKKGDLIWSGVVTRGDHVFVNKLIWNFRKPKRGEIMVFYTDGIKTLPPGTHYIKRMCGLPGETVSINPPDLVINGKPVHEPETIARVESQKNGYAGYRRDGNFADPGFSFHLGNDQYFAMGDNTANSRDSRYWGAVPAENLVGPATFVYWPLSKRWGIAR